MKNLAALPNQKGYAFLGVDQNGEEFVCYVDTGNDGCHTIKRGIDDEPYFFRLASWRPIDAKHAAAEEMIRLKRLLYEAGYKKDSSIINSWEHAFAHMSDLTK